MNLKAVGMENLPNVFIEKIIPRNKNGSNQIEIFLEMYDHKETKSWRDREINLLCKLHFENRATEIQNLNDGGSLYDYGGDVFSCDSTGPFVEKETVGEFTRYSAVRTYELGGVPENLNIYAACFIELEKKIGISYFDKFYGPMVGEKIIVGGQINMESGYFYYPNTNEEYLGPVHQSPDGGFMEGSSHTSSQHSRLVYVQENNNKIKDFSTVNFEVENLGRIDADISNLALNSQLVKSNEIFAVGSSRLDVFSGLDFGIGENLITANLITPPGGLS